MGNKSSKKSKSKKQDEPQEESTPKTKTTPTQNDNVTEAPAETKSESSSADIVVKSRKKKVEDEYANILIIDMGTAFIRAGFCGNSSPRSVFPQIVGNYKHPGFSTSSGKDIPEYYVGDEAQAKRGILNLTQAIEKGIFTDFDNMV